MAESEAWNFACNAVVVGRTVVTNVGCPELHRELQSRGYTPIATPLGEFVKSGGSAKCLTLRLDGEEAAGWKYAAKQELTTKDTKYTKGSRVGQASGASAGPPAFLFLTEK